MLDPVPLPFFVAILSTETLVYVTTLQFVELLGHDPYIYPY